MTGELAVASEVTVPSGSSGPTDWSSIRLALCRVGDGVVPFAVRAFAECGLADCFPEDGASVAEVANTARMAPAGLERIFRALARCGLLEEAPAGHYRLSAAAALLRRDHPFSMRDAYRLCALEVNAWAALEHSLRTGRAAFEHVYGMSHRAYRAQHPEEDVRMDRAHRASSAVELLGLSRSYAWSDVKTVVDVGGGTGVFLAGLLASFPHLRGVLLDLPRMVERVGETFARLGVAERVEIVGGDFFESIPRSADVYVLKAVVGGWDDANVQRVLESIRAAMRDDSRLLIIEPVLERAAGFTIGNMVHLQSLVLYGGPERTRESYEALAARAGLRLQRIVQRATLPILELVPHELGGGS